MSSISKISEQEAIVMVWVLDTKNKVPKLLKVVKNIIFKFFFRCLKEKVVAEQDWSDAYKHIEVSI